MPKPERPRKIKTSEKPATPRRRRDRAPATHPEAAPLASTAIHEQIAARAYELFLARGGQHGDDWADWFRAEAEVSGKMDREAVEVSHGRNPDRGR